MNSAIFSVVDLNEFPKATAVVVDHRFCISKCLGDCEKVEKWHKLILSTTIYKGL